MKAKMAIITCDSKYGCDQWAEDYWEELGGGKRMCLPADWVEGLDNEE